MQQRQVEEAAAASRLCLPQTPPEVLREEVDEISSIALSSLLEVSPSNTRAISPHYAKSSYRNGGKEEDSDASVDKIAPKDFTSTNCYKQSPSRQRCYSSSLSVPPLSSICRYNSSYAVVEEIELRRSRESSYRPFEDSTSFSSTLCTISSHNAETEPQCHSSSLIIDDDITTAQATTVTSEEEKANNNNTKVCSDCSTYNSTTGKGQCEEAENDEDLSVLAIGKESINSGNVLQKSKYDRCYCPHYVYHNPYNLSRFARLWLEVTKVPFLILWVYFTYFLVIVVLTANQSSKRVWLNAILAGLLVGVGLNANAYRAVMYRGSPDYGMVVRFFFIPFGVSALSGLTNNNLRDKFILVFPLDPIELSIAICSPTLVVCFLLLSRLYVLKRNKVRLTFRNCILNDKICT